MNVNSDKLADICIRVSCVFALIGTWYFWGTWWVLAAWLAVLPLAMLIGVLLGFVLAALGATMDAPSVFVDEDGSHIVERSSTIVGVLGEHKIHDWIVLKRPDNGELVRLTYDRIVDAKTWDDAPDGRWFALEPGGILYTEPENAAANTTPAA